MQARLKWISEKIFHRLWGRGRWCPGAKRQQRQKTGGSFLSLNPEQVRAWGNVCYHGNHRAHTQLRVGSFNLFSKTSALFLYKWQCTLFLQLQEKRISSSSTQVSRSTRLFSQHGPALLGCPRAPYLAFSLSSHTHFLGPCFYLIITLGQWNSPLAHRLSRKTRQMFWGPLQVYPWQLWSGVLSQSFTAFWYNHCSESFV